MGCAQRKRLKIKPHLQPMVEDAHGAPSNFVPLGDRPRRDGVLVLGMHRSGTSGMAGTLARLGVDLPRTLLPPNDTNPKGHWEPAELVSLHDELLASAGTCWSDWRKFDPEWYDTPIAARFKRLAKTVLAGEYGDSACFVLKDPRICRFARFWLEIFAEEGITPRIVIPVRQPLEVAYSLRTRDGLSLNYGILLWLRHALEAEAASRNLPRVFVLWDNFLKDWHSEAERMAAALGIGWPKPTATAAADIGLFLTAQLKREDVPDRMARLHPEMHEWAISAYEALRELSRDPETSRARAVLDDIAARFEGASRLFGPALASLDNDVAQRDARIADLANELKRYHQALTEHADEIAHLKSDLTQRDMALEEVLKSTAEQMAEIERQLNSSRQIFKAASRKIGNAPRDLSRKIRRHFSKTKC